MTVLIRNLLFLLLLKIPASFTPAHLQKVVPLQPPSNVIAPVWVIADLGIGVDGRVYLSRVLKGGEPLSGSALTNVNGWIFEPARIVAPVESHVTAIFLFRPRDIFSFPPPDLSRISLEGADAPPIPISLSDPGYPATLVAEGEVVLELKVSETGSVLAIETIKRIAGLERLTEETVRSWKFKPAMHSGEPTAGTAVVVITYLRPAVS